jgi:hypothetical protein
MKPTIEAGARLGWLTLGEAYQTPRKPGRTGQRWLCVCWCGADHDVSRESLMAGRVRACRRCAKAYRAQEDGAIPCR